MLSQLRVMTVFMPASLLAVCSMPLVLLAKEDRRDAITLVGDKSSDAASLPAHSGQQTELVQPCTVTCRFISCVCLRSLPVNRQVAMVAYAWTMQAACCKASGITLTRD